MIYLVYGEDTYRARKKIEGLTREFPSQRVVDGEEQGVKFSVGDVFVDQTSLFEDQPVLVLKNFLYSSRGAEFFAELQQALERIPKSRTVIFWQAGELDERFKFIKWLKSHVKVFKFDPLRKPGVKRWISDWLKGHKIEKAALEKLVEYQGNNLWLLENELAKARTFTGGRGITLKDIELLSARSVEENVFAFIDALSSNNRKEAGRLLWNLLKQGQDPAYLFSMVVRQFRLLLLAKTPDGLSRQHPFVARKVMQQAPRWDLGILTKIYRSLLDIDVTVKMGKKDLETELWLLVAGAVN